ncbi:MAG: nucleotide exchange factor GrpE [Xenococcaceae cyanobacterium]
MIDNKKQPETTLDHLEETSELSEKVESENLANQEGNLSLEPDSESISSEATATPEASPQVRAIDEGEDMPAEPESAVQQPEQIIEAFQQEIAALKQQLEEQTQQADALKTQYMRLAADFDNFRKRSLKEKEDLKQQVKGNTINELLSVVDNFERARTQIKPANEGEMAIHKSYQGVYKNLVDSLKRIGVSAMRPEGKPFDPNFHEAVYQEQTDEYSEGTVIEQMLRGYLLDDQILRHAMVKVAASKEPVITSEEENSEEQGNIDSRGN